MNGVQITKIQDEVYKKIGRNIYLLQKIETGLKILVSRSKISCPFSEFKTISNQQIAAVEKQTLGQLANHLFDNVFSSTEIENLPDLPKETWISFNFLFKIDTAAYEQRKKSLTSLVAERNELVHHFWHQYDLTKLEQCSLAEQYLDNQYEKIQKELRYLKFLLKLWQERTRGILDVFKSPEGKKNILLCQLVSLLLDIARKKARPDGWTLLTQAEKLIRKQASEQLDFFKERYGHKTLKSFIIASGIFDIYDEPTGKGETRLLYRIKP